MPLGYQPRDTHLGNRTCWSGTRPRTPSQGPSPKGSSHVHSSVLSWGRAANPIANPPTPRGDPITNSVGHPGSQHPGVRARASPTAPPLPKKPVPEGGARPVGGAGIPAANPLYQGGTPASCTSCKSRHHQPSASVEQPPRTSDPPTETTRAASSHPNPRKRNEWEYMVLRGKGRGTVEEGTRVDGGGKRKRRDGSEDILGQVIELLACHGPASGRSY